MSGQLSIGNELKDSLKETDKWVHNNVKWLKEVESFYRERAKLEKEYCEKLLHLTGEYFNKKSASSVPLSVGDTPTTSPGSIEAASVVTWNEILAQTELIAKEHGKLAQEFDGQIGGQLSGLHSKVDMTLSKIQGYGKEMTDRRNDVYNELERSKKAYDESCQVMENARNKNTKSPNERNKNKLAEKETDMNIAKNAYLIKINQANRVKDKYYFQDVPEALDLMQDLNEVRIIFLNEILKQASSFETNLGLQVQKRLETADTILSQNKPSLSTAMFIKHNVKQWKEPADFQYRPSPIWHDDEKFVVPSQVEANDLRMKLAVAEKEYNQNNDLAKGEFSQLSSLNKKKQEMKSNEDNIKGQEFFDNMKTYIGLVSSFTNHETMKLKSEVQIESIQNNTPSEFDLSTDNINISSTKKKTGFFSMFKQGLKSNDSKPHSGNSNKTHRSVFGSIGGTLNKRTSAVSSNDGGETSDFDDDSNYVSTNAASDTFSVNTGSANAGTGNSEQNKVLFSYTRQDDDEIDISLEDSISLVTADTGSGWTRIKNNTTGETGLVPTSYVEINQKASNSPRGPAPAAPPSRRVTASIRTVEAIYDYEAAGDDELSISQGETIKVIRGDDGSGWTYGESNGAKGLFPSSYCK
ncbi:hypothetical protein Kpol_1072p56 [Vanderwaltozyma polyspora DSM 70294]|uniref:Protein BZZ1 n=1 Tax=Vanderwaltozyma polyspora (strain ATCC 22028 / DSM 70294 / BCRC 21397 / CBS 2163 / NBRC 10782 / NRRL Y-8283 / UCD 57-17) TaxID=436907 RepID=A7TKS4_VANPO|nr:uncharacterized protein Kpol_1072p56 [Vanderwaltozyma polyspora DSM 70294]EDO17186.1 hypothetical protein Kpol_1072p56 [Vanderwaltozyma polyspora DSM 70294]